MPINEKNAQTEDLIRLLATEEIVLDFKNIESGAHFNAEPEVAELLISRGSAKITEEK